MLDKDGLTFPTQSLRETVAALRRIPGVVDPMFMAIGDKLAHALGALNTLQGDFNSLSARLQSAETQSLGQTLETVAAQSEELSRSLDQDSELLQPVLTVISGVSNALMTLKQVGTEIGALSVNAKVLAAQVNVTEVDFSVFTQEMGRLGRMEAEAVQKAEASLYSVRSSVDSAQNAMLQFGRNNVQELSHVAQRLDQCMTALFQQQRASSLALDRMSAMSQQIGAKVAQCISALQINDLTSQRIEHVATALEKICAMVEADSKNNEEFAWAAHYDRDRKIAMAATACKLQESQSAHALGEFNIEINKLKDSLVGLSQDVVAILDMASTVFQADGGESVIRTVQTQAEHASRLLVEYAEAKDSISTLMGAVSDGFNVMRDDISDINSLDADMRVMGLNATFKCGRLGHSGRALGVVAQELRVCSRKTEESSVYVSGLIAPITSVISGLVNRAHSENQQALDLTSKTQTAVTELTEMARLMESSLVVLKDGCGSLEKLLGQAGSSITVHNVMSQNLTPIIGILKDVGLSVSVDQAMESAIHDDISRFLAGNYTMEGERVIHSMLGTSTDGISSVSATTADSQSIDDMFF